MSRLRDLLGTVRRIVDEISEKNVTFMAAGIAYNALLSLAPVLLILFLIITAIGGGLEERILAISDRSLPRPIAAIINQVFKGDTADTGASAVGLIVLVWGTLKVFRGLDTAFSEIYESTAENSLADKFTDGFVVLVSMIVAILATVVLTAVFARFDDVIPFVGVFTSLVLLAGLIVAFLPMYYRFPDVDVEVVDVLPGTVFAAIGWSAFQGLFQVYLTSTGGGPESFFGGVIVVVTWLYFSGLVLLIGAVINSVIGGHVSGDPGGIVSEASDSESEPETTMTRDEFAQYLTGLREGVTGRYEGMRPTAGERNRGWSPANGDVVVTEESRADEGGTRWEIVMRWQTTEPGSNAGASGEAD